MVRMHKTTKAETEMLDHFAAKNRASRDQRKFSPQPQVGIFFVYEGRLLMEGTPVGNAEPYGDFKGHKRGHPDFWQMLQRNDIVPQNVEYDEVPRGRVGYEVKEQKFLVLMDKCILENQCIVDQIGRDLNLRSSNTAPPRLDSHYKCPGCAMKSKAQLLKEEADWDF